MHKMLRSIFLTKKRAPSFRSGYLWMFYKMSDGISFFPVGASTPRRVECHGGNNKKCVMRSVPLETFLLATKKQPVPITTKPSNANPNTASSRRQAR
jgi:hypothetical protein